MIQTMARPGSVPCVPDALPGGLSRTRFFDGMFLTQADLEREQRYWMTKRRLTNRALGTGVVWGLRMQWDERTRRFRLGPGYGLDCCGNDLILECPLEVTERTLVDVSDPRIKAILSGQASAGGRCPEPASEEGPRKACIVLQYVELPEEPRPMHRDACATEAEACEFSSVRETTRLLLVPPPPGPKPGPLEEFCAGLEELREEGGEDGSSLAGLFYPTQPDTMGAVLGVVATFQDGSSDEALLRPVANGVAEARLEGTGPQRFELRLEPAAGHVFLGGTVKTPNEDVAVTPFGARFETTDPNFNITIAGLQVASLFGGGSYTAADIQVMGAAVDSGAATLVTAATDAQEVAAPGGCAPPWTPAALDFGCLTAPCSARAIVLGLVWGLFRGSVGDEEEPGYAARATVAWVAGRAAWQLLFAADADHAQRARLVRLLRRLFEAWCAGFVYPGPRCVDEHHGVYLGCVEISTRGKVVGFDAWEHRRHVITGPLLSHWGAQLGLPPIDVVASRLVSWICCVSSSTAAELPEPEDRLLPLGPHGVALYYGDDLDGALEAHGLSLAGEVNHVSHAELCERVKEALLRGSREDRVGGTSDARVAYAVEGQPLHLLLPRRHAEFGDFVIIDRGGAVRREYGHAFAGARPLARESSLDFLDELARDTELSELSVAEGHRELVGELRSEGIVTVADFIAAGPEAAVHRTHPEIDGMEAEDADDLYRAAEELYASADGLMRDVASALKEVTSESPRPFVRRQLADSDVADKLRLAARTSYQSRRMTKKRAEEIASRAVTRGQAPER